MDDKLDPADKSEIEGKLSALKTALSGSDTGMIKTATEQLQQAFYKVSEKLYQQAAPQGGDPTGGAGFNPGAQPGGNNGGQTYYDADYTEVDPNS